MPWHWQVSNSPGCCCATGQASTRRACWPVEAAAVACLVAAVELEAVTAVMPLCCCWHCWSLSLRWQAPEAPVAPLCRPLVLPLARVQSESLLLHLLARLAPVLVPVWLAVGHLCGCDGRQSCLSWFCVWRRGSVRLSSAPVG